jgi:hypothetical protein
MRKRKIILFHSSFTKSIKQGIKTTTIRSVKKSSDFRINEVIKIQNLDFLIKIIKKKIIYKKDLNKVNYKKEGFKSRKEFLNFINEIYKANKRFYLYRFVKI